MNAKIETVFSLFKNLSIRSFRAAQEMHLEIDMEAVPSGNAVEILNSMESTVDTLKESAKELEEGINETCLSSEVEQALETISLIEQSLSSFMKAIEPYGFEKPARDSAKKKQRKRSSVPNNRNSFLNNSHPPTDFEKEIAYNTMIPQRESQSFQSPKKTVDVLAPLSPMTPPDFCLSQATLARLERDSKRKYLFISSLW